MAHEAILRLLVGHYVLNGTAPLTVLEKIRTTRSEFRILGVWGLLNLRFTISLSTTKDLTTDLTTNDQCHNGFSPKTSYVVKITKLRGSNNQTLWLK